MNETPFFVEHGASRLFAIWHEPQTRSDRIPFVLCHPFGEEKLWTHRTFVSFARVLAERGHAVLRFDYRGNGDSGSTFPESSLATAVEDIDAAVALTKRRTDSPRVGLVGLRLGASLAFIAAAKNADVGALVLWAPIISGERYLQELLRINLTTQMAAYREIRHDREELGRMLEAGATVNVDGYELGRAMANQLSALSLSEQLPLPSCPTLSVHIDRSEKATLPAELTSMIGRIPGAQLTVVREDPFWKEIQRFYDRAPNLFAATLEWLERSQLSNGAPPDESTSKAGNTA